MSPETLLAAGYAGFLLAAAAVLELLSAHTHRRSLRYRTAGFDYDEQHDHWRCPEGQHLWPHELDHERRLVRYRAKAHVCNGCPRKDACTDSDHGREIVRPLDPWPHSEAGRFHRGLSLLLVALALLVVAVGAARNHEPAEAGLLAALLGARAPGRPLAAARLPRAPGRLPGAVGLRRPAPDRHRRRRATPSQPLGLTEPDRGIGLMLVAVVLLAVAALAALALGVRILREYERAVVFRFGRLLPVRGPGLVLLIPVVDRMVRVDLRTVTLTVPPQDVITRDNVPARVAAVCYFRVVDPAAAITQIEAFAPATSQIAQTTLRSVLGGADLDQLLAERDPPQRGPAADHRRADRALGDQGLDRGDQGRRDPRGDAARHGPPGRGRARAPREDHQRRGRAPGGREARRRRRDHRPPAAALHLRYLQTLLEIGADQSSTIVFPLPMDLLAPFLGTAEAAAGHNGVSPR